MVRPAAGRIGEWTGLDSEQGVMHCVQSLGSKLLLTKGSANASDIHRFAGSGHACSCGQARWHTTWQRGGLEVSASGA